MTLSYSGPSDPKLPVSVRKLPRALREVWLRVFREHDEGAEEVGLAQKAAWVAVRRIQSAKEARMLERQDMDDIRVWLIGAKAIKTEEGKQFSSSAYLYHPDPNMPSTWKLRVEEEPGKVTVAQLGRAAAALGPGFRGNQVQMPAAARRACAARLIGMYHSHDVASEDIPDYLWAIAGKTKPGKKELAFSAGFKTLRQVDGRYRWVMLSSGAFEDRDNEIVSKGLLESAMEFADKYDYRGDLTIWHVKGSAVGVCDRQWLVGDPPFLLETGLFDETPAGQSAGAYYAEHASEKGGSIEFYAAKDDETGVWLPPGVVLRRSILPSEWAAFPWSGLAVKEHRMSKKREEVLQEFAGALGITPDDAEKVLQHLEAGSKQLADFGVRWKEADDETVETTESTSPAPTEETTTASDATVEAVVVEATTPEPAAASADTVMIEAAEPTDTLEVVITPDAMKSIVTEAATAVKGELQGVLDALAQRLEDLVNTVRIMGESQVSALAATKELQETVTGLKRTDDDKIASVVRNLPRATVKALQPQAVRPTQRTEDAAPGAGAESTESMLDRARKTIYG